MYTRTLKLTLTRTRIHPATLVRALTQLTTQGTDSYPHKMLILRSTGDSDHNSAAFSGHLTAGVTIYSENQKDGKIMLDRAWDVWTVGVGGDPNRTTEWGRPMGIEKQLAAATSG